MNNEDFEKRMEFFLEQRAQFAFDIQQLRKVQAQTDSVVARLANVTLAGFNDVNAKINALVDSQINLAEAQSRTDENLRKTDENLRSLIAGVDRSLSEGRNGT